MEDISKLIKIGGIIKAVKKSDWSEMLKYFPDGIKHRGDVYNDIDSFTEWDHYENYARYIGPAQTEMKNKCLDYAYQLLYELIN